MDLGREKRPRWARNAESHTWSRSRSSSLVTETDVKRPRLIELNDLSLVRLREVREDFAAMGRPPCVYDPSVTENRWAECSELNKKPRGGWTGERREIRGF